MNNEHRIINRSTGNLGKGDAPGLWQSIIDQIPNHAFFKGMRILNICAGTGTEARILVNRLKSLGWSKEEILESLHLIDNAYKFTGELKLQGFHNVTTADALTWKPKDNMPFDLIIGNPPYQLPKRGKQKASPQLYQKFVEHGFYLLKPGGFLVMIHPVTWRQGARKEFTEMKQLLSSSQMLYLSMNLKPWSGVGVTVDFYITQKTTPSKPTTIKVGEHLHLMSLAGRSSFSALDVIPETASILKKVLNLKEQNPNFKVKMTWPYKHSKVKTELHKFPFAAGGGYIKGEFHWLDWEHEHQRKPKVLFCGLRAFRPMFDPGQIGISSDVSYFLVKDEKEGRAVVQFLNSNICKFLQTYYSTDGTWLGNNAGFRNRHDYFSWLKTEDLPDSEELYQHFGLTPSEIKHIEDTLNV